LLAEASRAQVTRDALAKRIIELTRKGERDPIRLCEQALSA
jgi:tartrate dehydratase beta subunit/fumarate hydratase class I family protein